MFMKWSNRRRSSNIEDRRGMRMSRRTGLGSIGTIAVILIAMYLGVDPNTLLQMTGNPPLGTTQQQTAEYKPTAEEQQLAEFVAVVLADTEDAWNEIFSSSGETYQEPRLVLFTGSVNSACGLAQAAMGPFYCPADSKVYIDLSFYEDLRKRHNAPGDFAQAYVIAHEVGHHVQNLQGISSKVHKARQKLSKEQGNALSVRLELQADCYAGVWAYHTEKAKQVLEQGDVEEALNAASAIGDDRLQKQSRGYVTPDSFTHGSSAQRVRWFKQGMKSGRVQDCDTFNQDV